MSFNQIHATRSYLNVEVRAGTSLDPMLNPLIRTGPMDEGQVFGIECVAMYYRREGNPMVANSGMSFWNSVSLGQEVDIQ